jgi:hypothetical protein
MGQKINPTGFRLPVTRDWDSRWYASNKDFSQLLIEDLRVREYLGKKLKNASVARILIERPAKTARITIFSSRPGVVIGKKGADIDRIRKDINKFTDVQINDFEWYYNEKFSGWLCRDHIFRRGYFEMFAAQHGLSKFDELFFRRRPLPLAQAISPRVCVSKDDQKLLVHGLIHVVVLL